MPCVCRKTITPTQPKPAGLNSYTLRSFVINMRKETAPGGQVPTGILVAKLGSHPRAQPFSWQLRKSTFPSSPMREGVHRALCRHLSSAVAPQVSRELGQPAPIFILLFPGPECVAPASGGSGVPTGHLCSWPQCMNVHEEFPLNIYYPWYHSQQLAG